MILNFEVKSIRQEACKFEKLEWVSGPLYPKPFWAFEGRFHFQDKESQTQELHTTTNSDRTF